MLEYCFKLHEGEDVLAQQQGGGPPIGTGGIPVAHTACTYK